MSNRTVFLLIILIACCGILQAQPKMLDIAVTVMKDTELKIERGGCFVYWRPVYCTYPGNGYRLEAANGDRRGKIPAKSFSVNLGGDTMGWPAYNDKSPRLETSVCLMGRTVLRVTLRGVPGDGIVLGIRGEPGQVDLHSFSVPAPPIMESRPMRQGQSGAEPPAPTISLNADKAEIEIGQAVKLTWDAQNARSTQFSSGDLGMVEASGSAQVWPEKDTLFRIEARASGMKTSAEVLVKVTVPEPELELSFEAQTVYDDEEATLVWKTKNARLVRFADSQFSSLPLSGNMKIKVNNFEPIRLQAENGEKKVLKEVRAKVLNRKEEQERAAKEIARRTIPPGIDKILRRIWDDLKAALQAGDAEKAANLFCIEEREKYLEIYKSLKEKLPQVGAEMRKIEFLEYEEGGAKYRTKRKETLQGKEYDISYYVYFVIDPDGQWRLYRF